MDKTRVCGTLAPGSTPGRGTKILYKQKNHRSDDGFLISYLTSFDFLIIVESLDFFLSAVPFLIVPILAALSIAL